MRVSHGFTAVFDDPNLVSCGGLAPVVALAERAGLHDLVAARVRINTPGGVNAGLKVPALVAGMVAGADCIDGLDLLVERHGIPQGWRHAIPHGVRCCRLVRLDLLGVG